MTTDRTIHAMPASSGIHHVWVADCVSLPSGPGVDRSVSSTVERDTDPPRVFEDGRDAGSVGSARSAGGAPRRPAVVAARLRRSALKRQLVGVGPGADRIDDGILRLVDRPLGEVDGI